MTRQSTRHILLIEPAEFYANPETMETNVYQVDAHEPHEATEKKALKEFRAAIEDAYTFARNPANAASVKESIAKYTKLPPAAMATIVIPDTLQAKVTGPSLAFWVDVARDQGMIKGTPDPNSLVAP